MGLISYALGRSREMLAKQKLETEKSAYAEYLRWRTEMYANGFASYEHTPPQRGVDLILIRYEWSEPIFRRREDLLPEMNVNGLMWKAWTGETIEVEATKMIPG